jgi:hypothetical protein
VAQDVQLSYCTYQTKKEAAGNVFSQGRRRFGEFYQSEPPHDTKGLLWRQSKSLPGCPKLKI